MSALRPGWANAYVGIPFADKGRSRDGCDCWGLVRLALWEVFGIDAPLYGDGYETIADKREICRLIRGALPSWQKVGRERPGDIILLRSLQWPRHCGLVVRPGRMLHILPDINAAIERYTTPFWKPKMLGFYRWVGEPA